MTGSAPSALPSPRLRTPRRGGVRPAQLLGAAVLGLALLLASVAPAAWAATATPTGLRAAGVTTTTASVSWTPVKDAPRYRVQYSTSSSMAKAGYKRVSSALATLGGLAPGTRYYVKVRVIAADGSNLSAYSPAVALTTRPGYAAPAALRVTARSATSVGLVWTDRGAGIRYRVAYSTTSSMSRSAYVRSTPSSASVQGLKPSTTYWFKVRVITAAGESLSPYTTSVKATTASKVSTAAVPTAKTLRVGSFNIKCFNCLGTQPNERSWWDRRADVVSTILAQKVDVLGVQEASQAWLPATPGGPGEDLSQFEDLRNRLGGTWELANASRYNCERPKSTSSCVVKDQGASAGTKILYDRNRVDLLRNGSLPLTSPTTTVRYMAWAEFRQRSTGKRFFFADAHLEPNKDWILHRTEAREVAAKVQKENTAKLPAFVVGDMNSGKNSLDPQGVRDNSVYDVMVDQYHYVDPLGNRSGTTTTPVGATVERRINTSLSSYNDFNPVPSPLYYGTNARPNGTYIDYIFTSPRVRVTEWETVATLDANHHYVGKQASDHNMIRATVVLP